MTGEEVKNYYKHEGYVTYRMSFFNSHVIFQVTFVNDACLAKRKYKINRAKASGTKSTATIFSLRGIN